MENTFLTTIAGIDVLWESDCSAEIKEIKDLFKYHHAEMHDEQRPYHHIKYVPIWDLLSINSGLIPKWEGCFIDRDHKEKRIDLLIYPTTNERLLVLSEEIWIVHNREKSLTTCYLYCKQSKDGLVERPIISDTIIILLHSVMAMYNRYSIHAAAIEINGGAYVFVGESGHGKSTLCTDMARKGGGYLGDDIVFLYSEAGGFYVGSLLFNAKLIPDGGVKYNKDSIDVLEQSHGKVIFKTPIKKIFYILRHKKKKSRFKRMDPIETIVRLFKASNNIRMQYDEDVWLNICHEIADRIPYYMFYYGERGLVELEDFMNIKEG